MLAGAASRPHRTITNKPRNYNNYKDMDISTYNKTVAAYCQQALNLAFIKFNVKLDYSSRDTDCVTYFVYVDKEEVKVLFTCFDVKNLWNFAEKHLTSRHYRGKSETIQEFLPD